MVSEDAVEEDYDYLIIMASKNHLNLSAVRNNSITLLLVILAIIACYPPFNTVDEITQKMIMNTALKFAVLPVLFFGQSLGMVAQTDWYNPMVDSLLPIH